VWANPGADAYNTRDFLTSPALFWGYFQTNTRMAEFAPGANVSGYSVERVIARCGMGVIYSVRELQSERA
jgi:hypothetical protein